MDDHRRMSGTAGLVSTIWSALAAVVLQATLGATVVRAHEFWLEPMNYRPEVGAVVPVNQRSGSEFEGFTYPYLREDTRRFSEINRLGEQPINAIDGDDPAATIKFKTSGLSRVIYVGPINEVVFPTFAKFEESVKYEQLPQFAEMHKAAGKPMTAIRETYMRCAKALIGVGAAQGSDIPVGMPIELVAETNPYISKPTNPMVFRLLLDGKPAPGITVKLFNRKTPSSPSMAATDATGRASFILKWPGEYMAHAVSMRTPTLTEGGDWFSLWASLSFVRQ